jgi:recombination protein RecT
MGAEFQNAVAIIAKQEEKFLQLISSANSGVDFKTELLYASQAMLNNDYLCRTALNNPLSLRNAFSQVAANGLTLNPSRGLAYLVPRDSQVILDISWRGMVKAAVVDGAIRDCIVELVYSLDKFEYRGKRQSPLHSFNPFAKKDSRGEFIGAYVEATLPDGRIHVEAVSAEDIYAARDASDLWKRKKKGPWLDFFTSMAKKSAIKIARKYWPQSSAKLDEAIQYLNETVQEGFASNQEVPVSVVEKYMGAVEVDEGETQPLPGSEAIDETAPKEASVVEGEFVEAEAAQVVEVKTEVEKAKRVTEADIPPKVAGKVEELVKRATLQGCWAAARDYVSSWPVEARDYALLQLKAAEYATASGA